MTPAQKEAGDFARAVSGEIRALIGRHQTSGRSVAERAKLGNNYFHIRLRDEKSFTLDDVAKIAPVFGMTPLELLRAAAAAQATKASYELAAREGEDGIAHDEIPDVSA